MAVLLSSAPTFFVNCGSGDGGSDAGSDAGGASGGDGYGSSSGNGTSNGGAGADNESGGGNGSGAAGSNGGNGDGGRSGAAGASPTPTTTPGPAPTVTPGPITGPSPAGVWTIGQSLVKNWDSGAPAWQGDNTIAFAGVEAGATLVLCVYGYTFPTVAFSKPTDSQAQPVAVAVDTGTERSVQATAWVLHNAKAGTHTWTNLPDFSSGDGKLFFAEFRHGGVPSTQVLGAATKTLNAYEPPWLTSGSVTMKSGANPGDLLVAFSLEEESGIGNENTPYTDPPAGWMSLGVQNQTEINIGGQASWRLAPDASPQTVSWSWTITGGQDPSLFKAAIFAIHAPLSRYSLGSAAARGRNPSASPTGLSSLRGAGSTDPSARRVKWHRRVRV